jgi:ammonia channel protein AmtB
MLGDFSFAGLSSVGSQPLMLTAPQVPSIVFSLYQLQFAAVTVAIIVNASFSNNCSLAERQDASKFFPQSCLCLFGPHWYMIPWRIGPGVHVVGLRTCLV